MQVVIRHLAPATSTDELPAADNLRAQLFIRPKGQKKAPACVFRCPIRHGSPSRLLSSLEALQQAGQGNGNAGAPDIVTPAGQEVSFGFNHATRDRKSVV